MNKDVTTMMEKETVRMCLSFSPEATRTRLLEIKGRLEHVTALMQELGPPPETGNFLLVVKPDGKADRWYRIKRDINLGRGEDVSVMLPDDKVSRLHARIEADGEDLVLLDQSSRNGTQVNGENIDRHVLSDGDLLGVGRFELVFVRNFPPEID